MGLSCSRQAPLKTPNAKWCTSVSKGDNGVLAYPKAKVLKTLQETLPSLPTDVLSLVAEFAQQTYHWPGQTKVILLGARDTGKSTFFRHLCFRRQQNQDSYVYLKELAMYSELPPECDAASILHNIQCSLEELAGEIYDVRHENPNSDSSTYVAMAKRKHAWKGLWENTEVQNKFQSRDLLDLQWVNPNLPYYMEHIDRILSHGGYRVTFEDSLRCYAHTSGIQMLQLRLSPCGGNLLVTDVGGARSSRRKWRNTFQSAAVVVFMTDISAYDQVCLEDEVTNRLDEDFRIWEQLLMHKYTFKCIILLINKIDLFEEKIKRRTFKIAFPEYEGDPHSAEECKEYYVKKLQSAYDLSWWDKDLHVYFTSLLDTERIQSDILPELERIVFDVRLKMAAAAHKWTPIHGTVSHLMSQ